MRPLRESTQIFLQLLASVFAIYRLIPKDYPGLRDTNVGLSLFNILGTAWQNLKFTREGAPQVVLFFAITGLMVFSGFLVVSALLSLFVGHAHAQSMFAPPATDTNDLAQSWIDFVFNAASFPAGFDNPFAKGTLGGTWLQTALISALAIYSDAILIIAALILFYHLTAMVVETAHHGEPMGKRASKIWAPIRLVVAIGLLLPIAGGLNSGQFIVIKMAELGLGLASYVWSSFLTTMINQNIAQAIVPPAPNQTNVAVDIIRMQACANAWNQRADNSGVGIAHIVPTCPQAMVGDTQGYKCSYSSTSLADIDICGWYFIPTGGSNAILNSALTIQTEVLNADLFSGPAAQAAAKIYDVMDNSGATGTPPAMDATLQTAIAKYQTDLSTQMQGLVDNETGQVNTALTGMQKYGWVMAGAFLNSIDRMEAGLSEAVTSSAPTTSPPRLGFMDDDGQPKQNWWQKLWGDNSDAWNMRKQVAQDMQAYSWYQGKAITSTASAADNTAAQCAAMVGLNASTGGDDAQTKVANWLFSMVDSVATWNGVWSAGSGSNCGGAAAPGAGPPTFSLGIKFGGQDPFAQMSFLGHANLKTAVDIVGKIAMAKAGAAAVGLFTAIPGVGGAIAGGLQAVMGAAIAVVQPVAMLIAGIFWASGFTLAFILPLMPFMRFTFSVLAWFFAIIEAVIAVPLVALAHLNPEGEGLPGKARTAYFYVFNLFLRPVMTVFGLICGLVLFLIAVSFINFAYEIAVAGAGGTAYSMAALARLCYTILYVVMIYVCANHAFALIDHMPAHALDWMGEKSQAIPQMGNTDKIEQLGSVAGTYMGAKAAGASCRRRRRRSGYAGEDGHKRCRETGRKRKIYAFVVTYRVRRPGRVIALVKVRHWQATRRCIPELLHIVPSRG